MDTEKKQMATFDLNGKDESSFRGSEKYKETVTHWREAVALKAAVHSKVLKKKTE